MVIVEWGRIDRVITGQRGDTGKFLTSLQDKDGDDVVAFEHDHLQDAKIMAQLLSTQYDLLYLR